MTKLGERILAALEGLDVMQGDLKHVETCLLRVEPNKQKELVENYKAIWTSTYNLEPNMIFKANAARRKANLWIDERTA